MFDINQILIRLYAHAYRKNDRAFDKDSKEIISEFERLDKDNEWLKADKEICNNTIQDLLKTNQILKAENERLREENKEYILWKNKDIKEKEDWKKWVEFKNTLEGRNI